MMTDNEIIKANTESNTEKQNQHVNSEITDDEVVEDLKKWISMSKYISEPVFVQHILLQRILNIIIRQKAEIERLSVKEKTLKAIINHYERQLKTAKTEARKEFWNNRPERRNEQFEGKEAYNKGWNACLDEFCKILDEME